MHSAADDTPLHQGPLDEGPLARFVADEQASAAVEFVVLIPVYILLMVALFVVGNLVLARQGLVMAVRFQAWQIQDPASDGRTPGFSDNGRAFFASVPGRFEPGGREQRPSALPGRMAANADLNPTGTTPGDLTANARDIAVAVFNNADDPPLLLSRASGSFEYGGAGGGVTLLGLPPIVQRTRASVLLPRAHIRREYEPGQAHPIAAWGRPGFDLEAERNLPLSPLYPPYFGDRGGADKGIWNRDARINGRDGDERSYYEGKLR